MMIRQTCCWRCAETLQQRPISDRGPGPGEDATACRRLAVTCRPGPWAGHESVGEGCAVVRLAIWMELVGLAVGSEGRCEEGWGGSGARV